MIDLEALAGDLRAAGFDVTGPYDPGQGVGPRIRCGDFTILDDGPTTFAMTDDYFRMIDVIRQYLPSNNPMCTCTHPLTEHRDTGWKTECSHGSCQCPYFNRAVAVDMHDITLLRARIAANLQYTEIHCAIDVLESLLSGGEFIEGNDVRNEINERLAYLATFRSLFGFDSEENPPKADDLIAALKKLETAP